MAFFLWAGLCLLLAVLLIFSSQLEFLVPGVAAAVILLVSLIPGIADNFLLQTLLWVALSGLGLRIFWKKIQALRHPKGLAVEDRSVGCRASVEEAIDETAPGRIRFRGTTWVARAAEAIPVGTEVEILAQEGLVYQVARLNADIIAAEFKALEQQKEV